jgi:hypothetical protein
MIAVELGTCAVAVSTNGSGLDFDARSRHPEPGFEMIKALTGARGKIE